MAERDVKVLHCPGSNLKLGSGLAPVVEMRAPRHQRVARGRRRRLQQPAEHVRRDAAGGHAAGRAPRPRGAAGARRGVDGHARGRPSPGARREIGSLEPGKRADFIVVDAPRAAPGARATTPIRCWSTPPRPTMCARSWWTASPGRRRAVAADGPGRVPTPPPGHRDCGAARPNAPTLVARAGPDACARAGRHAAAVLRSV